MITMYWLYTGKGKVSFTVESVPEGSSNDAVFRSFRREGGDPSARGSTQSSEMETDEYHSRHCTRNSSKIRLQNHDGWVSIKIFYQKIVPSTAVEWPLWSTMTGCDQWTLEAGHARESAGSPSNVLCRSRPSSQVTDQSGFTWSADSELLPLWIIQLYHNLYRIHFERLSQTVMRL